MYDITAVSERASACNNTLSCNQTNFDLPLLHVCSHPSHRLTTLPTHVSFVRRNDAPVPGHGRMRHLNLCTQCLRSPPSPATDTARSARGSTLPASPSQARTAHHPRLPAAMALIIADQPLPAASHPAASASPSVQAGRASCGGGAWDVLPAANERGGEGLGAHAYSRALGRTAPRLSIGAASSRRWRARAG